MQLVPFVRLEMPWRTKGNQVDCGIFLMRHMEKYKANGSRAWSDFYCEGVWNIVWSYYLHRLEYKTLKFVFNKMNLFVMKILCIYKHEVICYDNFMHPNQSRQLARLRALYCHKIIKSPLNIWKDLPIFELDLFR